MFKLFSFAEEKAFAKTLVEELMRTLPPKLIDGQRKILSVNKVTRVLEQVYEKASAGRTQRRMGFIRRVAFANAFKWAMTDSGYPKDFVDVATEGLVVELSRDARKRSGRESSDKTGR